MTNKNIKKYLFSQLDKEAQVVAVERYRDNMSDMDHQHTSEIVSDLMANTLDEYGYPYEGCQLTWSLDYSQGDYVEFHGHANTEVLSDRLLNNEVHKSHKELLDKAMEDNLEVWVELLEPDIYRTMTGETVSIDGDSVEVMVEEIYGIDESYDSDYFWKKHDEVKGLLEDFRWEVEKDVVKTRKMMMDRGYEYLESLYSDESIAGMLKESNYLFDSEGYMVE